MSYNRGNNMYRDGGRRSNDFGGGGRRSVAGGGGGGNYRSNFGSYNSSMNPWEGGMVPGRGGGGGGSGHMQGSGQGDLLSQLASPEAQLALASNLINKLINQQSAPSLLNLGNMGSSGGHMSSYNDGYGNSRNFMDRRRGRMDQRRTEPYNKSGMYRRMDSDRRNLGRDRVNSDRKTSFAKSPKTQDDKDKKDKDAEKANGDVKVDSADDSKREEGKEEESKEEEKMLDPIPPALLYCHVCCKNMWDEISFTKHMKGRPHQLMMDGMNEKYKLKVDLLRHEMRLAEKQREMELDRKKRHGMKIYNHPREYCAMCDLHFHGNLISHRKNIRHQKLKAFLHPKCSHCDKEFSTRLEWDDHRLTFPHLQKVAEFRRLTKPHVKDDEFDIDELVNPDIINCGDTVAKEVPVINRHDSDEDISVEPKDDPKEKEKEIKTEPKDEDEKEEGKAEETKEEKKEPEVPQGLDVDPLSLPKYNSAVVIGKDLLKPVSGYVCQVCNRFLQGDEEAQVHCRTLAHHTNYCNVVRAKARITNRRKRSQGNKDGKADDDKNEPEKADENADDSKLDISADDEGNWKRRKTNSNENTEVKMELDESKNEEESKEEENDSSVWEDVDKDIDAVYDEVSKDLEENADEDQEDEATSSPSAKRTSTRARGNSRGRRGGKRGK